MSHFEKKKTGRTRSGNSDKLSDTGRGLGPGPKFEACAGLYVVALFLLLSASVLIRITALIYLALN